MKAKIQYRLVCFVAAVIMGLLPTTLWAATQQQGQLQLTVTGIKNDQGVVRVAFYNSAQGFQDRVHPIQSAYRIAALKIINQQATYTFSALPYGTYAIKLFHDEDNSGKFKKNMLGIPQEGFGFSNNPVVKMKSPVYAQTQFVVNQPKMSMTIQMINPK